MSSSPRRLPVLSYDPLDADRDVSRPPDEHARDILNLCQQLSTQGSAFSKREDLDNRQLPMLRFVKTVIPALPTEFNAVTTSIRSIWQQTSQKLTNENCFTIVEGINPGAEMPPPVFMKSSSSDTGSPVEQIILGESNYLPENGLFEIRDTRTGRLIHPSELPFTLTFTPSSPFISPVSKSYGPITPAEIQASAKAHKKSERKKKYEEAHHWIHRGCGAPISRPRVLPSDASDHMGFLMKCMEEDAASKERANMQMMMKYERRKYLKKLRKWRKYLQARVRENEQKEKQDEQEAAEVDSTQHADALQGTQEGSGTASETSSVSFCAPAVSASGAIAELLIAKKKNKRLLFNFKRPRIVGGTFIGRKSPAKLWVQSTAAENILPSAPTQADVLDPSSSSALIVSSSPVSGAIEASTSTSAPVLTKSTPFSPSNEPSSTSQLPTTNAEQTDTVRKWVEDTHFRPAEMEMIDPHIAAAESVNSRSSTAICNAIPQDKPIEAFTPSVIVDEATGSSPVLSHLPNTFPSEPFCAPSAPATVTVKSDGEMGDDIVCARTANLFSPSHFVLTRKAEGKKRARNEEDENAVVDVACVRPAKRIRPQQS